jgi:hypothetical protein
VFSVIALIAGICLVLLTTGAAHTVGVVLIIAGGVLIAIPLLIFVLVAIGIVSTRSRF